MPEVLVLQHLACETLGTIADALTATGLTTRFVRAFEDEPIPPTIGAAVGLIVMGGSMGVYEQARYPFLTDELHLLVDTLDRQIPILGICLGAQLLAAALGADVAPSLAPEIGWHPIQLFEAAKTDRLWHGLPSPFMGFHWHNDLFSLPKGTVSLASSVQTPCQAFRFGENAYGLQFHLEVTEAVVREWTDAFADELPAAGLTAHSLLGPLPDSMPSMAEIGATVFGRWASLAANQA